jgi:hypothetical protein
VLVTAADSRRGENARQPSDVAGSIPEPFALKVSAAAEGEAGTRVWSALVWAESGELAGALLEAGAGSFASTSEP